MDALHVTDAALKPNLIIRQFNQLTPYLDRFQDMKKLTETRDENTPDELWILQHHDVLTQGQAGKPEHILMSSSIPVVQTDRGGQVTWHGPGQLVAYFMFDLNRLGWNVRTLVSYAENLMIDLLKKYDIEAYAKPDAPGQMHRASMSMNVKLAHWVLKFVKDVAIMVLHSILIVTCLDFRLLIHVVMQA